MNDTTEIPLDSKSLAKAPIVRGARACTVCRQAKMKCVGAEDGLKPCQRCKRANVECVFEKHRRGRKPGSKLSEASKMLRRLEKGLNTAKLKSQVAEGADVRGNTTDPQYCSMQALENAWEQSHAQLSQDTGTSYPIDNFGRHGPRSMDDEDEIDRSEDMIRPAPAEMIKSETRRHSSFFNTILNPEESSPSTTSQTRTQLGPQARPASQTTGLQDPISAGIIDEADAKVFFDLLYLRLNPFVNLFDPALHTVAYVRSKCPFLFTTIIMAGCKFFKPEAYKACQKLANEFATTAFAEAWKRVEVVQAFACLTYWSIPEDNRTWTYIGYACRMAVELGLNRYVPNPPSDESELHKLERRNRERTYLVLFVHDRSLSTQTGKHWMLPEDDLVRNSSIWHKEGDTTIRHEDIVVTAFVALRRITTSEVHASAHCMSPGGTRQVDYVRLRQCNHELEQWTIHWKNEMSRAGGQKFHTSLLSFFSLHVSLYLNSFAVQAIKSSNSANGDDIDSLRICFRSARESLRIVSEDYASMSMLRYGQDSVLVMSAYSAIMLLKLLRSSAAAPFLQITAEDVYRLIRQTSDAYKHTSTNSAETTSTISHARFLENLVTTDIAHTLKERDRYNHNIPLDPRLISTAGTHSANHNSAGFLTSAPETHMTFPPPVNSSQTQPFNYDYPTSPRGTHPPVSPQTPSYQYPVYSSTYQAMSEQDAHYQRLMFSETNFGDYNVGSSPLQTVENRRYTKVEQGYTSSSHSQHYSHPIHYPHAQSSVQGNLNY